MWRAGILLSALLGACNDARCPIDLGDVSCTTSAACADAGEGLACATAGASCQLCVPATYHSYVARCESATDGGLVWTVYRGTPPPGCPPSR